MGVDWYACVICGDTFPDCGEYGNCGGCGESMCITCHNEQSDKYGHVEEDSEGADDYGDSATAECDDCTKSLLRDADLVEFLLLKVGMTKDDVITAIKKERGII